MELGTFLRLKRKEQNYTLQDLSQKTDLSINYLYRLETGKVKRPSPPTMNKISIALNLNLEEIYSYLRG